MYESTLKSDGGNDDNEHGETFLSEVDQRNQVIKLIVIAYLQLLRH